jgi:primosomal protein N' (replication factor Y)
VFATVAVPIPLGQAFSYRVPAEFGTLSVGARVLCEFGRQRVLGVVLEITSEPPKDIAPERIKPLIAVADGEPALPDELLRFLRELAAYYLAPIGEVLRLALPQLERSKVSESSREMFQDAGVNLLGRMVQVLVLADEASRAAGDLTKLKGKAKLLWEELAPGSEQPIAELERKHGSVRSAVASLVKAGLARIEQRAKAVDSFFKDPVVRDTAKALNAQQRTAVESIIAALAARSVQGYLLQGVTGSGKTEVYLQIVAACLDSGGAAIVLVPEIALTPQLVGRFRARFGDQIAVLHSGLSGPDRARMWRELREGRLSVAVGARSALFAPVRDLRLICVDEEHDSSFKQEEGVRYNARDMALLRAHRAKAVCVLGSATPSMSSEHLAREGRLQRLLLPERAVAGSVLPEVQLINLRNTGPGPSGHRLLTLPLHRELEEVLKAGRQAILFLNRRGFAPSLICESCGAVCECPNCSVALTMHRAKGEQLRCHYCDYIADGLPPCAKCKSRRYSQEGAGTERIESVLKDSFPTARIARLDRDVAGGLKSEAILERMRKGELDILVGTQMVTKGHDLPQVSLVGVLNADAALSLPDFQAAERTFQLLVQVAGRAGRAQVRGRVLIQTRTPEHPAIRLAEHHDFSAFVESELAQRKDAHYPPYYRLLLVRLDAADVGLVQRAAERCGVIAQKAIGSAAEVLGPSPAPIERLRNRFRYRIIVRSTKRAPLYAAAHALMGQRWDRRLRIGYDFDPVNLL